MVPNVPRNPTEVLSARMGEPRLQKILPGSTLSESEAGLIKPWQIAQGFSKGLSKTSNGGRFSMPWHLKRSRLSERSGAGP